MLRLAPPLGSGVLTYLLYGYSLSLSFMLDDFDDLARAATASVTTILTSSRGYVYYRPLAHIMEKLPYAVQGYYDPFWYHLMPLSLHALNGWMVYLLARRLAGAWAAPWAAVFFLAYPFSYQVVPWVGAVMHPLMVFFALGALLAYYEARQRSSATWMAIAMVSAVLALPAHENGVLIGAMAVALEVYLWRNGAVAKPSARCLLLLAPAVAFQAVWLLIPKQPQPWTFDPNSLKLNALFFLQGLVFPVAGVLEAVGGKTGMAGEDLAWVALPFSLAVLALIYTLRRSALFFLLNLCWFSLAVLPAWALLSYAYVIDGPRLFYLASVPSALLWAGLWQLPRVGVWGDAPPIPRPGRGWLPKGGGWGPAFWRFGLLGISLALLYQSWAFLAVREDLFKNGSRVVWQVADMVAQRPEARALLVNVPAWFTVKEPEYPMGHMGVTFLPDYLGLNRTVFMHRGVNPTVDSLEYKDLLKSWRYHYGPHGPTVGLEELAASVARADDAYLASYEPEGVRLELAGRLDRSAAGSENPLLAGDASFVADFGGRLSLREARVRFEGRILLVDLRWLLRSAVSEDLTVFLHVYDSGGRLVAQEDGYPLRGLFPFRFWPSGLLVEDLRRMAIPRGLAPGDYTISLGVYDRASGARQVARDQRGTPYPDNSVTVGRLSLPDIVP